MPEEPASDRLRVWRALLEPDGQELVAKAMEIQDPAHPEPRHLAALRELAEPSLVAAVLDLCQARRKGASKFEQAAHMLMDVAGVEQASADDVAGWKARRFEERGEPVWDLCSGIGGDAMAMAAVVPELVAVDLDPLACLMTAHNLDLAESASSRKGATRCCSVEDLLGSGELNNTLLHIDPARRVAGSHSGRAGRSWAYEDIRPGPQILEAILEQSRGAAIKLGPGVDLEELALVAESEIEILASRGGLKQVVLWSGALAGEPGLRRASRVEKGQSYAGRPLPLPRHRSETSAFLYIPDPALERAGLVGTRLMELGAEAWNLHPGLDYLHGPAELCDPWFACYRIEAVLPWRDKKLRGWLSKNGGGDVEIRTRGGAVVVEKARRELRGSGDKNYVIFGLRLGKRILAFVTTAL